MVRASLAAAGVLAAALMQTCWAASKVRAHESCECVLKRVPSATVRMRLGPQKRVLAEALHDQVDHHTVKMHTSFLQNREDGDFSFWEESFRLADTDRDGLIPVREAPRIFKEHYNLVHKKDSDRGAAAEIHYMDDGEEFAQMVCASARVCGAYHVQPCRNRLGHRGVGRRQMMVCDSSAFAQVLDTRGWDGNKSMLYDDFLKALHEYVDIKHRERGALYDMAASIF